MKRVIFIIFALIFIISCSQKSEDSDLPFEETIENVYVKYENGMLSYKITIEKPTPCYKIIKNERVMESYPVQVYVDISIESSDEICIQVIAEETVKGTINIGYKPGSFAIRLNENIIYSTNLEIHQ